MTTLHMASEARRLKERLPRVWGAFFGRHGNFTAAQLAAIPRLLDGDNVLICAPTASGKTEAAVAPLVERHLSPERSTPTLAILYLLPTRALVNDVSVRLAQALDPLSVSCAVKTRDLSTFRPDHPADVLLTTPESLDSLLTTQAKILATLRAVILDELHLFDGTARGDQLRVLLNRVRQIRDYAHQHGDAPDTQIQYAALSATMPDPDIAAARYFPHPQVIALPGTRPLKAEFIALESDSAAALMSYLQTLRARGWRKALVFCNSRAEVEAYATAIRTGKSPFGDSIYVHYSNIEAGRRREIETRLAQDESAICFASSTLELGIDIGDIDVVLLIGPPGDPAAFVQRIGRGSRRQLVTQVACFYRTPLEELMFRALTGSRGEFAEKSSAFRPSVAIQQIFSLLKQSPTGGVRLAELAALFDSLLSSADLERILGELQARQYVKVGRPGEWRADSRLNRLLDIQAAPQNNLSIYSNIQSGDARKMLIRDRNTQETVATVDAQWFDRELLTLEGRPVNVEWYDGEALWVTAYRGGDDARRLHYRSQRQLLNYSLARLLPLQVGLSPGDAPLIETEDGWLWFHWLGDLYGRAVLDLLRYHMAAQETGAPGLCLLLPDEPANFLSFSETQIRRYLEDNYRRYEPLLALGPFHDLLPFDLRRRTVVEQFNVALFREAISKLRPMRAPESLSDDLIHLLG